MNLQISSSEDFSRLLDGLAEDIVDAAIHLGLYSDLNAVIPESHRELNSAPAFWSLTFQAHWKVALGCLIRACDQHPASLCLVNLIDTITASPHLQLLRATTSPATDSAAFVSDRAEVSPVDPLLKRLVALRGNVLAHRSAANVLDQRKLEKRFCLILQDAKTLVARAVSLINAYSNQHRQSSWSTQIVGHDDYLSVLKCVRESREARDERLQQEMRRLGIDTA